MNQSRPLQRRQQSGFTLIEIMVVVVILGILAALVVPQVMSRPDQAKVTVAKGDIKAIAAALDMYKLDNFAYPSTQQGLEALVKKPTGNPQPKNWNKDGYLKKLPVDPWGNPYRTWRRAPRARSTCIRWAPTARKAAATTTPTSATGTTDRTCGLRAASPSSS